MQRVSQPAIESIRDLLLHNGAAAGSRPVEPALLAAAVQVLAAEIERVERAKTVFLRNMNHEVRTPLNGLLGGCSLLEETSLDEEQREYLHLITSSAERLARTLGLALELAALESREGELRRQPFALDDVLHPLVTAYSPQATARGLCLRVRGPVGNGPTLVGDAPRIRHAVAQVIENALAFTSNGWIEVGAELRAEASTCQLRLWIEDTGRGIDPRDHERVFEPFEQADSSCTREHEGAGLGLCIARQIVERMGGILRVGEAKHGGARFELELRLPFAQHVPA